MSEVDFGVGRGSVLVEALDQVARTQRTDPPKSREALGSGAGLGEDVAALDGEERERFRAHAPQEADASALVRRPRQAGLAEARLDDFEITG